VATRSFDTVLELSDHKTGQEDETLGSGNETEGLVRNNAGLGREMRERHPQQEKSTQNVELDETSGRGSFTYFYRLCHCPMPKHKDQTLKPNEIQTRGFGGGRSRALH
jgi:hypothetical protein